MPFAVKPRSAPRPAVAASSLAVTQEAPAVALLRRTLIGLVLLLTFEGLVRKLEPGTISAVVFLLKDVVVLFMAFNLARIRLNPAG